LSDKLNTTAYLIDNAQEINSDWLKGVSVVGLTAGASAPELLVQNVVERLKELGVTQVNELDGRPEKVEFSLPKELKVDISALSH
jgi:4-hydroxy-3-methylbut-2-enyl diphosphate reductase